jgi:hypothetical protein
VFDIVGDVHGHADKLVQLLKALGYNNSTGIWAHPTRKLISLGDLVDRGPQQREVIDILKPVQLAGHAHVIMGNHEFNAVSWFLTGSNGQHLRVHSDKNYSQHAQFLDQANVNSNWYQETIAWFQSLPLLIELGDFCCVHAAWDKVNIEYLKQYLTGDLTLHSSQWEAANDKMHPLYEAIEYCLKSPEISLPDGYTFKDTNGNIRDKMRLKWWDVEDNSTYQTTAVSVPNPLLLPDEVLPSNTIENAPPKKPVFFGHYWMEGVPEILSDTIACLD